MNILTHWDINSLATPQEYEQLFTSSFAEVAAILPPTLYQLHAVMRERISYFNRAIDRNHMAESLYTAHKKRNALASSLQNIELLKNENTFLIIAGQQPGILTGPLYTFYKILHAVILAERLSREMSYTFLPAYWNASEDHDFNEIATCWWLSKDGNAESFTWPSDADRRRPFHTILAAEFPLTECLEWIRSLSHPTEFSEEILQLISSCHQNARCYPDFVDALIWRLFPEEGLIILRPDDAYVGEESRAILRRELHNPRHSSKSVADIGLLLNRHGVKTRLHKREERTSFFLVREERRIPIFCDGDGFIDDANNHYSLQQLLLLLDHQPQSFSSTAILRPVIQDALFPTAITIVGPGEMAYHLLLDGLYRAHEIPRPALANRFGFTLVENRDLRQLEKYDLSPTDLRQDTMALIKTLLQKENRAEMKEKRIILEHTLDDFFEYTIGKARFVDPTIIKALEKNRAKIQRDIEQTEALILRREAEKNEITRRQICALQSALFPEGDLQERRYTIFYYLMKYGMHFIKDFKAACGDLEAGKHLVVQVP